MAKQRILRLVPPLESSGTGDDWLPDPVSFGVVLPEAPAPSRDMAREEQLADILRCDCYTPAAEELARITREGAGSIEFHELPDLGDVGVDHRALSIVESSDPDTARLFLAAALWLGHRGSRWRIDASTRQSGEPEIVSDDENLVAWAAPVDATRILAAWAEGRRVMVVGSRKDGRAVAFVFAPRTRTSR